jgi:hypothetical protein
VRPARRTRPNATTRGRLRLPLASCAHDDRDLRGCDSL